MKKCIHELLGTYALVLVGTGSVVLGWSNFSIAVAFGVIVMLMILAFGNTSGAHINPMVSISFFIINKDKELLKYLPFQFMGAIAASLTIQLIWKDTPTYGETVFSVSTTNGILIELFISFGLMLTILMIIRAGKTWLTAVIVGFYVFLAAYSCGPYTGASMNPARSFGPAVFSNTISIFWIYMPVTIIGGVSAVFLENILINKNLLKERS